MLFIAFYINVDYITKRNLLTYNIKDRPNISGGGFYV